MCSSQVSVARREAALLVVDLQHDFLPGGSLAVTEGDAIVAPIAKLMNRDLFGVVAATQDWHPRDHASFASNHPGRRPLETVELFGYRQMLWPEHCVAGSAGAALHPGLPWERVALVIRKGMEREYDSYSAFRSNLGPDGTRKTTGLAGYLRERAVSGVFLCGLARDYCVRWSAEDAAQAGFRAFVLWDLTRPVDPGSDSAVRDALAQAGVAVVFSEQLRAAS